MAVAHRLQVDPVACDAFGHCAELFPERIWLDEWGYPVLDAEDVPPALLELARQAVRACPRRALALRRVTATEPGRAQEPERVRLIARAGPTPRRPAPRR